MRLTGKKRLLSIGYIGLLIAGFMCCLTRTAQALDEEPIGSKPSGVYEKLGIRTGVFNDGQAAIWDLDIFDHFRWFGPKERARGYQPEQPINFSHITHVQANGMDCQYCHWSVAKASYAELPEVRACMGCHGIALGTSEAQQKEIAKIKDYYTRQEPIPWVKVHVMPNYVRFNHKRHVKGGVACQECHGQIPNMPVVQRVSSMKMGWCVQCHRDRGASVDCYTCHH